MCSRSSIIVPRLVELRFHPPRGQPKTLSFFTRNIVHSTKRQYLTYSEGDFEVFSPHRADALHRCD